MSKHLKFHSVHRTGTMVFKIGETSPSIDPLSVVKEELSLANLSFDEAAIDFKENASSHTNLTGWGFSFWIEWNISHLSL